MKILVFAGTTEGRNLIEKLLQVKKSNEKQHRELSISACVATDYGKEILADNYNEEIYIKDGRLNVEEMQQFISKEDFDFVIDATHPYATEVTKNIKTACEKTGKKYIRLLRDKTDFGSDCIFVENTEAAVEYLNSIEGNIFLTVGSKELAKYTAVRNYEERMFARVLPMVEVLESCKKLGFSGKHLICMQGPYTIGMNKVMLKDLQCDFMVTKDTGKEGGAYEKFLAAKEAGVKLIVVGRNGEDTGNSIDEVLEVIFSGEVVGGLESGISQLAEVESDGLELEGSQAEEFSKWFPLFINISDKNVAVVGGGKIARRRIKALLQFSCNVRIIAKEVSTEVKTLVAECLERIEKTESNRSVEILEKEFDMGDLEGANMVIMATNQRELNSHIGIKCKELGMLVNIADNREECDFYFPGVAIHGDLVVGITAQGKNHGLAKKATTVIREQIMQL